MPLTRTEPRHRHFTSLSPHGFHRVVYHEWGEPANPRVVICVHGIGRNGRDFDVFEVPLDFVLDPANQQRQFRMQGDVRRDFWAIPWRDRYIWGATAAMLLILDRTLRAE
jgi:hypothetical protein